MDLKQAIEIQRVRLLRLLTGWFVVFGFLSVAPVPVPRWARVFLDDVLTRAECAARNMVYASALIKSNGGLVQPFATLCPQPEIADDVPTTAALLRRMKALRRMLQDLPRHARRIMRVQKIPGEAFDFSAPPRACLSANAMPPLPHRMPQFFGAVARLDSS